MPALRGKQSVSKDTGKNDNIFKRAAWVFTRTQTAKNRAREDPSVTPETHGLKVKGACFQLPIRVDNGSAPQLPPLAFEEGFKADFENVHTGAHGYVDAKTPPATDQAADVTGTTSTHTDLKRVNSCLPFEEDNKSVGKTTNVVDSDNSSLPSSYATSSTSNVTKESSFHDSGHASDTSYGSDNDSSRSGKVGTLVKPTKRLHIDEKACMFAPLDDFDELFVTKKYENKHDIDPSAKGQPFTIPEDNENTYPASSVEENKVLACDNDDAKENVSHEETDFAIWSLRPRFNQPIEGPINMAFYDPPLRETKRPLGETTRPSLLVGNRLAPNSTKTNNVGAANYEDYHNGPNARYQNLTEVEPESLGSTPSTFNICAYGTMQLLPEGPRYDGDMDYRYFSLQTSSSVQSNPRGFSFALPSIDGTIPYPNATGPHHFSRASGSYHETDHNGDTSMHDTHHVSATGSHRHAAVGVNASEAYEPGRVVDGYDGDDEGNVSSSAGSSGGRSSSSRASKRKRGNDDDENVLGVGRAGKARRVMRAVKHGRRQGKA
ncbi:MAG: hypothetical protein M1831_004745 [Alyxoria varia]|nr:MAG: hypothetical protein M1831_004745 [Alyxoria varia]